jgi:hypothetical protein
MGSAADLILASPTEASSIIASEYPLGTFKGVNVDGLDPLKLAALHSVCAARSLADVLPAYQPIGQASPRGPWLVRIPEELVVLLGRIAPPDQMSTAAKWCETDQAQEEGWPPEVADQFLGRLIPFAQTAAFEGQGLFLWIYN